MNKEVYALTVLIPVYNTERYLSQCLDSVLAAEIPNMQVVLVDDGSKDTSPAICDKYACEHSNFLVIHQENAGVSVARNNGIQAAKGEYIFFLDSDDTVDPGIFRAFSECICTSDHKPDVILHDMMLVHAITGAEKLLPPRANWKSLHNVSGLEALQALLKAEPYFDWFGCRCFYRNEFLKIHDFKFLKGLIYEDAPWVSKALILADKVDYLQHVGIRYMVCREGSLVNSVSLKHVMSRVIVADHASRFAMEHIKDQELLDMLLANLGEFFVSAFRGYCNSVPEGYPYLKKYLWIVKYTKSRTGKFIYYSTKLLGFSIGMFLSKLMFKATNRNNKVGHQFEF